jgi:hypothetical protein
MQCYEFNKSTLYRKKLSAHVRWCTERICKPENVEARQDTTAEDIFSRCSKDILNPILTNTNSTGSSGAPSQPAQLKNFNKHACATYKLAYMDLISKK